jgi:hypothetical protein
MAGGHIKDVFQDVSRIFPIHINNLLGFLNRENKNLSKCQHPNFVSSGGSDDYLDKALKEKAQMVNFLS